MAPLSRVFLSFVQDFLANISNVFNFNKVMAINLLKI
jgi:hypothetical protein